MAAQAAVPPTPSQQLRASALRYSTGGASAAAAAPPAPPSLVSLLDSPPPAPLSSSSKVKSVGRSAARVGAKGDIGGAALSASWAAASVASALGFSAAAGGAAGSIVNAGIYDDLGATFAAWRDDPLMMGPLAPSAGGEGSAGGGAGGGRLDVGDLAFARLPSPTHKKTMTPKATTPAPPAASLQGASRSGARSGAGATAVQSPPLAVLRSPLPQSPQPRDARGLPTPRATTDGKRRQSLLMTGASPLSSPAGGARAGGAGGAMASPSARLDRSRALSPRGVPSALASPLPTSPAAIALAVIPSAPPSPAPPPRATPAPRSRHTSARRTPARDENHHAFAGDGGDAVPLSQSVDLPPLWGAAEAPAMIPAAAGSIVLLKTVPARAETAEALGVPHFLSPVRRSVRKGGAAGGSAMRSDSLESAGGAWAGNPALPGVSLTAGYADAAAPGAASAMKRSGFFVKRAGAAGSESAARLPLGMSALQPLDVSLGPPIELTQMNI